MLLHFRCISFKNVRFPTHVGISPVRVLESMYKYIRCVIEQMHVGIVPVRPALSIYRYYRWVKLHSASGIVEVSVFLLRYSDFRNGKHPIESES